MVQSARIIETGLATTGLIKGSIIIILFLVFILGMARNPSLKEQFFALAEAIYLFTLMMALLLLYVTFI